VSLSAEVFGSDSWVHKLTNLGGLGIPGWLDRKFGTGAPDPQYNSLGDMSRQTAEEGQPRVVVWGRVRPIGGNLIYCQPPKKKWIPSFQDIGDDVQVTFQQRVYRTYAIGVCEGPITRFRRIWRNDKMIYDSRNTHWGNRNNAAFWKNHVLYYGAWDQMPCPELQMVFGIDIPAHRGTAYMVCVNHDLTETGGAVPSYQFEVERAEGVYLTSRPYAIEGLEGMESMPATVRQPPHLDPDLMEQYPTVITAGVLRDPVHVYTVPAEAFDLVPAELLSGTLRDIYKDYTVPAEAFDLVPAVISGSLDDIVEPYTVPAEAIDAGSPIITGGTLT